MQYWFFLADVQLHHFLDFSQNDIAFKSVGKFKLY